MNRETKIGLLTGLFVIILVGVLLSEYLGGADHAPKQAVLTDVGAEYRHRTLNQVGVPVLDRDTGHVLNNAILPREDQLPLASAAMGPTVTPAVAPIPVAGMDAERVRLRDEQERQAAIAAAQRQQQLAMQAQQLAQQQLAQQQQQARPTQTTQLVSADKPTMPAAADAVTYVPGTKAETIELAAATPKATPDLKPVKAHNEEYVIAKGDTLGKIATKFYGTQKGDAIARIIAANPETLKDGVKSGLVVGKKLIIPSADVQMVSAAAASMQPIAPVPASPTKVENTTVLPKVIPVTSRVDAPSAKPAEKKAETKADTKVDQPKSAHKGVYTVEKGDTVGIIAKKMYGSSKPAFVKAILEANKGVKSENLKIGQELKIPEKPN